MPKSASVKKVPVKTASKSTAKSLSSDRSQLVKSLVDLYAAQEIHHSKSEQKQFFTLIQSHWASMPKPVQTEIRKKLASRQDLPTELTALLGIKQAVAEKPKTEKVAPPTTIAKAPKPVISNGAAPNMWWEQPSLFFSMPIALRQQGLMALSERKFPCATLYPVPSYNFDQFKRNYFANKTEAVQAALIESLEINAEIADLVIQDKDMLAICVAARAMGATEKDITSIVIFNAGQFANPSFDAFDRIKWFAKVPQIAIEQVIHVWQGKMTAKTHKSSKSAAKQANVAQKALENVQIKLKSDSKKILVPENAKPKSIVFNAADAFKSK